MAGVSDKRLISHIAIGAALGSSFAMASVAWAGDPYTRSVTIQRPVDDVWAALVTKSIVDTYYFLPISSDVTEAGQAIY